MNIDKTMWQYFLDGNGKEDKTKLVYFGRKIALSEMTESVLKVATFLKSRGIGKGDVVGIILPNMPEAIIAMYAINALGGIVSFLDPRVGEVALYKIVKKTKPKLIFLLDVVYRRHKNIFEELKVLLVLCNLFSYAKFPASGLGKILKVREIPYFADALKNYPLSHYETGTGKATAVYVHSGGTTGEPKTAVFDSRAFNSVSRGIVNAIHPTGGYDPFKDSMLMMLPIFHSFGLAVPGHGVLSVIASVLMPSFSARVALKLIGKYKITHIAGIPYMLKKMMMCKSFKSKNVSSIKYIFCGGDKLIPELKAEFNEKIKKLGSSAEILEGYGLTETASVLAVTRPGEKNLLTQGLPLEGTEVKIFDKEGEECPAKEIGEIHVKSNSLMKGYLNDKKTNSKIIYTDEKGNKWLKTSDLGWLDEKGLLYFTERETRTLKIAANLVFPSAIEGVVNSLPYVKNSCAARAKDSQGKPYIKLFVNVSSLDKENDQTETHIKEQIAKTLSKYDVPREIVFVSSIKRTPLGKADYMVYETGFINT